MKRYTNVQRGAIDFYEAEYTHMCLNNAYQNWSRAQFIDTGKYLQAILLVHIGNPIFFNLSFALCFCLPTHAVFAVQIGMWFSLLPLFVRGTVFGVCGECVWILESERMCKYSPTLKWPVRHTFENKCSHTQLTVGNYHLFMGRSLGV